MRFSSALVLALPLLAAADQQPLGGMLQGLLNKAKTYIPSAVPSSPSPVEDVVVEVVLKKVETINRDNWRSLLAPNVSTTGEGPETWMMFVSGGNKTCYGRCANVEKAWNESISLLSADPACPNLGYLNCDEQGILCATLYTGPPSIWHIQVPQYQPSQEIQAPTVIHILPLNVTNTTALDIAKIHTEKKYEERPVYESAFHPFDGILAQYNLIEPVGYAFWAFGMVPSWAFMILISFISRTMMSRRLGTPGEARQRAATAQAQR
ncbi:MAG: hypothetical protein M1834_003050 [Cirrosporium novae-zelandiae]|nr:MAG: hypothetical protein M1834_003050 [Cirrosporium novae-zelandiae]